MSIVTAEELTSVFEGVVKHTEACNEPLAVVFCSCISTCRCTVYGAWGMVHGSWDIANQTNKTPHKKNRKPKNEKPRKENGAWGMGHEAWGMMHEA